MDRELYKPKKVFFEDGTSKLPKWDCPTCVNSKLELVSNSFERNETVTSRIETKGLPIQECIYEYNCRFSLVCQNEDCREIVYCIGHGQGEVVVHGSREEAVQVFEEAYTPLFFVPNLTIFPIPNATPEKVVDLLNHSFSLFYANPYASANQVRRATEVLLTEQGVNRFTLSKQPDQKTGKRKRKELSLHQRIEKFRKQNKNLELEKLLIAIKHLGNTGSHTSKELVHDDVLDSYELMEYVLNFLYSKTDSVISKAQKINKSKGPVKKKIKRFNLRKRNH